MPRALTILALAAGLIATVIPSAGALRVPTTTYVPTGASTTPSAATTPTASTPGATSTPTVGAPATSQTTAPAGLTGVSKAKGRSNGKLSAGAIAIVVIAALLLLACLAWALARRRAFEPHWLLSLRHALAEAGFRASETWSEFADWARLGR